MPVHPSTKLPTALRTRSMGTSATIAPTPNCHMRPKVTKYAGAGLVMVNTTQNANETTVRQDRKMRTFGWFVAAQEAAKRLDDETRGLLEAYSAGVNACMVERKGRLDPLFAELGIEPEPWGGALLKWAEDKSAAGGVTVWHVAAKDTQWFAPSACSFMINYRVDNMAELLAQLRRNGVEILKGPDSDENGTFAWILDPDGNKVELWEPAPSDEENKTA